MASDTLLLNSTYEPLKIISWQRAITMMWLQKVEVLEHHERVLRSVSMSLRTPSVVRLHRYIKRRRLKVALSRRNIYLRDRGCCQYCHTALDIRNFTLDHVVPRSRGGGTSWSNIVASCGPCNRRKGSKMPKEARMQLSQPPREPAAMSHFFIEYRDGMPDAWAQFLEPYVGKMAS